MEIFSEEEEKKTKTSLSSDDISLQMRLGRRQKQLSLNRFLVKIA
jgi:hypothetical protein